VDFYPGAGYFDIAALDVYRNDFQKSYYNGLRKLAAGKPVALAEVGPAPAPSVLKQQPQWTWWMLWAVGGRGMAVTNGSVKALVNDPRSLSRDDPEYIEGIAPIRAASGLAPLPSASRPAQN
jgi:mannan endo-1,4-beta-mannosidase